MAINNLKEKIGKLFFPHDASSGLNIVQMSSDKNWSHAGWLMTAANKCVSIILQFNELHISQDLVLSFLSFFLFCPVVLYKWHLNSPTKN